MFAITLINKDGGSRATIGHTIAAAKLAASRLSDAFPNCYIAATLPYPIDKGNSTYDISIPLEIKKSLGIELRFLAEEE